MLNDSNQGVREAATSCIEVCQECCLSVGLVYLKEAYSNDMPSACWNKVSILRYSNGSHFFCNGIVSMLEFHLMTI